MSNYEDDRYLDGEEKRPTLLPLLLFIILIVIILVVVISCSMKKTNVTSTRTKNTNELSYIKVSDSTIEPEFKSNIYSYDVTTDKDSVMITCGLKNSSSLLDGCNEEFKLTSNQETYVIKVSSGSITKSYTLNIRKKSNLKTVVSVTSEENVGKNSYTLKAVVSPLSDDLIYSWYKDDEVIPNSDSSYITVTKTGNYYVNVKDSKSTLNIYSNVAVINIENSDDNKSKSNSNNNSSNNSSTTSKYTLKINDVKGNSNTWVKKITLTVSASASNGLASKAYSFDGGKTYQNSNSKSFTNNQNVKIVVKDSKGNTVSKNIELTKIDSNVPKVTISGSNEKSNSILLSANVSPAKTASSYKYQWYKNGSAIKNATSYLYKATSAGKYKVVVTTGSGNKVTSSEYKYILNSEKCPILSAITKDKKYVAPKSWIGEPVYIKINVPKNIVKYDVYVNEDGGYKNLNTNLKYFNTFTKDVAIKLSSGGMRYIKIVTYDKAGNKANCNSEIYYIR